MSLSELVHLDFIPWLVPWQHMTLILNFLDVLELGLNLSSFTAAHSPMGWGKIRRKAKALMHWVRGGANLCTPGEQRRDFFTTSHWRAEVQPVAGQQMWWLLGKWRRPSAQVLLLPRPFLELLLQTTTLYSPEYCCGQCTSLSPCVPC